MISSYYKRISFLALTKPKKIPALYRLKTGARKLTGKRLLRSDNFSPPPLTIAIRPTYRCNLRCIQCGQWGKRGYLKDANKDWCSEDKELTTQQWKSFISEVTQFRPYIYFTGGEPLLRDDVFELIRFASSNNLVTSLSTNCTLLKERSEEVLTSGLDYLYASLDGPSAINDTIRLGVDSSKRAVLGVKKLIEKRQNSKGFLPIVDVRTTITEENQDSLLDMAKFVDKEIKADVFGISLLEFTTEALAEATSRVYEKELGIKGNCWKGFAQNTSGINTERLRDQIEKIKNSKWNFKLHIYLPMDTNEFTYETYFKYPDQFIGHVSFCGALYAFTQLQPNGDVATCASVPDYVVGNILREKFMKIWNGEKYRKLREYTKKNLFPACSRCRHIYTFRNYAN